MIANLPIYISVTFVLTTLATLLFFYFSVKNSSLETTRKKATLVILVSLFWLALQAILALLNIYNSSTNSLPPRIAIFGILPTMLFLVILFFTKNGKQFIDSLALKTITYLNVIRIPVELVLFWLFINKAIPQIMTFEGLNFDIVAGISAPIVAYLVFTKNKLNKTFLLIWNFACLALLINIIVIAFISAPSPLQKIAFEQPNMAILNFPFCWLPTFVVPIVLFGHFVSIRQLLKK
ncbi:MAG: hypothetical protein V4667_05135 [Bacteroidota bacterium]